jgi:endoglucanase
MSAGGTDAGMLQRMVAGGSIAGGLSVPLRHLHTSVELVHKEDLQHWIQLLIVTLREIGSNDFSWE